MARRVGGRPIRTFHIWLCRDFRGIQPIEEPATTAATAPTTTATAPAAPAAVTTTSAAATSAPAGPQTDGGFD